jgi:hypothetical protein
MINPLVGKICKKNKQLTGLLPISKIENQTYYIITAADQVLAAVGDNSLFLSYIGNNIFF